LQRPAQIVDVLAHAILADVAHWAGARVRASSAASSPRPRNVRRPCRVHHFRLGVHRRKLERIAGFAGESERRVNRRQTAKALGDVARKTGLAVFTVSDHVEAALDLLLNNVSHCCMPQGCHGL
jgi:hypothetical protein